MAKFIRSKAARFAAKIDWESEKYAELHRISSYLAIEEDHWPEIYTINLEANESRIDIANLTTLVRLENSGYKPVTYYTLTTFRELQVADSQARIRKNLLQRLRRAK